MKTLLTSTLRQPSSTGPIANSKKSFLASPYNVPVFDQQANSVESISAAYYTTGQMTLDSRSSNYMTSNNSKQNKHTQPPTIFANNSNKLNISSTSSKLKSNSKDKETKSKQQFSSSKINIATALGLKVINSKLINFKVQIRCTSEKFEVTNFPVQVRVRELKGLLELICGIPFNLQRLSYLDDGEMLDSKELQYYDVIDGAELMMDVWTIYVGLLQASVYGSLEEALKQGVSNKVEWHSPTSDYMYRQDKSAYIAERGGIALFIAAHRGNVELVKGLVNYGVDVNYESAFGRTPLMISVVANKSEIIDHLLSKNADTEVCDLNGDCALSIAKKFGNRLGQHKLAQYKWKKRTEAEAQAKEASRERADDLCVLNDHRLPHQVFDSSQKTWFKGNFMQMYMMQLEPLGEFSGSRFSAPKSIGLEGKFYYFCIDF